MKKALTVFLTILIILTLSACSEPTESGDKLYNMSDFSVPPKAVGDTPVISLEDMIQYVNKTEKFKLSFAEYLDSCQQTLYKNKELQNGEELKESIEPLGVLTYIFNENDFSIFLDVKAEDFELLENGKLAKIKEGKGPATYMNSVVTDFCLDLTDAACVIRGMYITDTETQSTFFVTLRLKYHDNNKYTLRLLTEDYGLSNNKEHAFISDETLTFVTEQWDVIECNYTCKQDTSLIERESESNITKQQAERLVTTLTLTQKNNIYHVNRNINMKQSYDSYHPDKAKDIYDVTQVIEFKDDKYLLTETANFKNEQGNLDKMEQFVIFQKKILTNFS